MGKVLIIDDDQSTCEILQLMVEKIGHIAECCHTMEEGLKAVEKGFDVVFLDVRLPDASGLEHIEEIQNRTHPPEVIIITGAGSSDGAETAIRSGAWDYLQKPLSPKSILLPIKRVLEYRENLKNSHTAPKMLKRKQIVGSSRMLEEALERLALATGNESNVLILGETGTGKEVFARVLHDNSGRADGRLVVVDCAALPENLMESSLFGHVRGAFTSADRAAIGLVKLADGGTLFLDEIGELDLALQKTLLRVLQEKSYRPVGATQEQKSDFRLVAATNKNLEKMVDEGSFREDLLFRLRSHVIHVPPLRQRIDDLEALVVHYTSVITERNCLKRKGYSPDFIETLQHYHWPGNIRELIHTVEQAVIKSQDAPIMYPQHLPKSLRIKIIDSQLKSTSNGTTAGGEIPSDLSGPPRAEEQMLPSLGEFRDSALNSLEKTYLQRLMEQSDGETKKALAIAGIGRTHLYNLLKKHSISR